MMLSKLTWILFFVALCFRSSESAYPNNIQVLNCHDDATVVHFLSIHPTRKIPILITKNEFAEIDETLIRDFDRRYFMYLIRVYVDDDKCPVTYGYFLSGQTLPAVVIVRQKFSTESVYFTGGTLTLDTLCAKADDRRLQWTSENVAEAIQKRINERMLQEAYVAASQGHAAASQGHGAAAQAYATTAQVIRNRETQLRYSVAEAGGPSGTRKSSSPPPTTQGSSTAVTQAVTANPGGASGSNYGQRRPREVSPPDAGQQRAAQRPRGAGQFTGPQTSPVGSRTYSTAPMFDLNRSPPPSPPQC